MATLGADGTFTFTETSAYSGNNGRAAILNDRRRASGPASPRKLVMIYARGKGNAQMIPGWPYSVIAALEPGRTSCTLPLDAVRRGPADDATGVTAA